MKQLMKLALVLATIFAATFILIKVTGILTVDDIETILAAAAQINPVYVALCVVVLLFSDLFIAVPTLTVAILSGHFLGFILGGVSAMTGMILAGLAGYTICWLYGPGLLLRIYKNPAKLAQMRELFFRHSTAVLLMCRALPILPEVCCCLAGANRLPFWRFFLCYSAATIPYAFIAAYAGSRSSLSDPMPAIFTAIGISLFLWLAWIIFLRKNYGKRIPELCTLNN